MLAVIIEECGAGFAPYIEEASTIITAMLDFGNNDNIRSSAAESLPYLVKSAKAANIDQQSLFNMCKKYVSDISKAIVIEWETEVKMSQINAIKDIIDEAGPGFYGQEEIDGISTSIIGLVDKSLERIDASKKEEKELKEDSDEGEEFGEDDAAMYKEEIKIEYEL